MAFCPLNVTGLTVKEPEGPPTLPTSQSPQHGAGLWWAAGTSWLMQKLRKVPGSLGPLKQLQLLSGVNTADPGAQGTGVESLR